MDTKPTQNPDPEAQVVPDLPLTAEQATDVKGGKIYDAASKGTHVPAVVVETW